MQQLFWRAGLAAVVISSAFTLLVSAAPVPITNGSLCSKNPLSTTSRCSSVTHSGRLAAIIGVETGAASQANAEDVSVLDARARSAKSAAPKRAAAPRRAAARPKQRAAVRSKQRAAPKQRAASRQRAAPKRAAPKAAVSRQRAAPKAAVSRQRAAPKAAVSRQRAAPKAAVQRVAPKAAVQRVAPKAAVQRVAPKAAVPQQKAAPAQKAAPKPSAPEKPHHKSIGEKLRVRSSLPIIITTAVLTRCDRRIGLRVSGNISRCVA
jgi:hypothetical protein